VDAYVPGMLDMCLRRLQANLETKGKGVCRSRGVYLYGRAERVYMYVHVTPPTQSIHPNTHTHTHTSKTHAGNPYGKCKLTLSLLETVASALHYNAPLTLQVGHMYIIYFLYI
jgi:hypothetical protein